jgi:hypothetical protein
MSLSEEDANFKFMSKGCLPPTQIVLAIIGARTFSSQSTFDAAMDAWIEQYGMPDRVVSGGAKGADTYGEQWARANDIPAEILRPDWRPGGVYDPRAALNRNTDIIRACTHVLAFPSTSGSGTQDALRKAEELGKPAEVHWCTK